VFIAGVIATGDKLFTSVNITGDVVATGVNDTGDETVTKHYLAYPSKSKNHYTVQCTVCMCKQQPNSISTE
jgi:hypothetical protein